MAPIAIAAVSNGVRWTDGSTIQTAPSPAELLDQLDEPAAIVCEREFHGGRPTLELAPRPEADGVDLARRDAHYLSDGLQSLWNVRAEVFADPARPGFDGDRGWIRGFKYAGDGVSALDLMETVMTTGQEHHHGFVHGDVTEELSELASWLDLREVAPLQYRDAMQRPDHGRQMRKGGSS